MDNNKKYTDEFRTEAAKQVTERSFSVMDVACRLGVPKHPQAARKTAPVPGAATTPSDSANIRRLKAKLPRATKERRILKKSRRVLCQGSKAKYAFMRAFARRFRLVTICQAPNVQHARYYTWQRHGANACERDDQRLLGLIKLHSLISGMAYGYRKIAPDLREVSEQCSRHRVLRPMKAAERLRAQVNHVIVTVRRAWLPMCSTGTSRRRRRTRPASRASPESAPTNTGCSLQ